MEKEVEEAWLIKATHLGDYDLDSMWYVLHGAFLDELKQEQTAAWSNKTAETPR